jgi:aryl-alcohol dehydrogenase-like predicted oxidoreductase
MELRQLGRTDMRVSVLGFGGAEIGFEGATQDTVTKLLDDALDAGLNIIDTAECYPGSEELIGQAVAGRRKDYFLFTKCGHPVVYTDADWRPESLSMTIERSLQRLKTDRLDLVQLHTCTEADLRKGDVIAALQKARDRGQTRYIGYSGDGSAAKYAIECGAFDSLQTSLSVLDQDNIDQFMPLAVEKKIGVIVKRPIGNAVWRYKDQRPTLPYHQPYWDRLQKLKYDFAASDPANAATVALRFTLSVPGVHTAIVGTTKPGRWRENAAMIAAGPLPPEQFNAIRNHWRSVADKNWLGLT